MTAMRVGHGFDVHPFRSPSAASDERRLRLAGVDIPDAPPLDGHSDADVAVHAVVDALLGALAMGDLGSRFGRDEPEMAGTDSIGLLREVIADVRAAGWTLGNLDVTIIAQRPRLADHREAMRAALATACDVALDAVSVKMTTTDRLGAIGRAEGIAAIATCGVVSLRR